jgi:septal ring factor EnvC (AmiA/AmiB activator)
VSTPHVRTALSVAIAIALLAVVALRADPPKNPDLERVKAEILRLRQRLEGVRQQAKTAQRDLEETDLELSLRTTELQLAVETERKLEAERQTVVQQIATIEPQLAANRRYLAGRLGALYRLGSLGYVRLFFSMDGERDPLEAISTLRYLVQRDARTLETVRRTQTELAGRQLELAARQAKVVDAKRVVEERRRQVFASRLAKERLLDSLRVSEQGSAKQLAELEEKARRLERLVTVLSQQAQGAAPILDIRSVTGALPWPVTGKVIENFGRQRNAKFATVTTSNGLKIEAASGTPVHAVFQGTVLFSQWFKGYGNLIILDHGNRVFTLYGNLKSPAVAPGDRIAAGQAIAAVGESEDAASGYLYFEVRQNNRPEDPQKWLR